MPWYERGQKKYFYRSKRINGKPRRLYLGTGEAAERAAAEDEQRRQERQAAKAELEAKLTSLQEIEALVEKYYRLTELLLAAELMEAGFHKYGGEWRRRRGRASRSEE
jgi:hypothetical protein